jgi:anti-sigma factor RsiW
MTAPIDDLTLHAWLDGELPPERAAAVEAWLQQHADDAARVRAWAADREQLRTELAGALDEPVPAALEQVLWRDPGAAAGADLHADPRAGPHPVSRADLRADPRADSRADVRADPRADQPADTGRPARTEADAVSGWRRWAAAVTIFALGGALGAGAMWRAQGGAAGARLAGASGASGAAVEPAWVARAAVAHAVYVPEVRHPVEVRAQEEHLSRWLTRRLDVPVKLFDLRAQGFELVGGRLLPDATGPSAQLMYQQIVPAAPATPPAASGGAASASASSAAPGGAATAPRVAAAASGTPGAASGADAKPLRVTVYLRKPEAGTPAAFRYEQQGALGLFYWVEGASAHGVPTGYALVGALPRERLLALAEAIYQQGQTPPR